MSTTRLTTYGIFGLIFVVSGTRIKLHRQHVSFNFDAWSKGSAFICMKKWRKGAFLGGVLGGAGHTNNYCLVDLEQMVDANHKGGKSNDYSMIVSTLLGTCGAKGKPHAMQLCMFKGKNDKRISYSKRLDVPKACFSRSSDTFNPDGKTSISILRAAITATECSDIMSSKQAGWGEFAKEITQAPTTSLATSQERVPTDDQMEGADDEDVLTVDDDAPEVKPKAEIEKGGEVQDELEEESVESLAIKDVKSVVGDTAHVTDAAADDDIESKSQVDTDNVAVAKIHDRNRFFKKVSKFARGKLLKKRNETVVSNDINISGKICTPCGLVGAPPMDDRFRTLLCRSEELPYEIPSSANRLNAACHSMTQQRETVDNARRTRPIIHPKVEQFIDSFLTYKKDRGTEVEQIIYKNMSATGLYHRLFTKRPLMFMKGTDMYLTRYNKGGNGHSNTHTHFDRIGSDQEERFKLEDYQSYEEMELSALLGASVPTHFINDGRRNNRCKRSEDGTFEDRGILVGLVGARFERQGKMEWKHMVVTSSQNRPENGYGEDGARVNPLLTEWAHLYGLHHFPTYEEALHEMRVGNTHRFISGGGLKEDELLDTTVLRARYRITAEMFLAEANERAEVEGKRAFCHVTGLGLGVWKVHNKQKDIQVQAYFDAISSMDIQYVDELAFSYFGYCPLCRNTVIRTSRGDEVRLSFSKRNPSAKLPDEKSHLLVIQYAWDSNSYPGNEYWAGPSYFSASGDPAAACSSNIPELQNPDVNIEAFAGDRMHVVQMQTTASTNEPMDVPSHMPSDETIDEPSGHLTEETGMPLDEPTEQPTEESTEEQTGEPTNEPTEKLEEPTGEPTETTPTSTTAPSDATPAPTDTTPTTTTTTTQATPAPTVTVPTPINATPALTTMPADGTLSPMNARHRNARLGNVRNSNARHSNSRHSKARPRHRGRHRPPTEQPTESTEEFTGEPADEPTETLEEPKSEATETIPTPTAAATDATPAPTDAMPTTTITPTEATSAPTDIALAPTATPTDVLLAPTHATPTPVKATPTPPPTPTERTLAPINARYSNVRHNYHRQGNARHSNARLQKRGRPRPRPGFRRGIAKA